MLLAMDEDGPQLGAAGATMAAFIEALRRRHDSIEAWLEAKAGFGPHAVQALRRRMMRPRARF